MVCIQLKPILDIFLSGFSLSSCPQHSLKVFLLLNPTCLVQTGSEAHQTSYLSLGVKRPGREADHSPPTSAEVKKTWIYTSTPPYVFMA
jgi:hypothetical protein